MTATGTMPGTWESYAHMDVYNMTAEHGLLVNNTLFPPAPSSTMIMPVSKNWAPLGLITIIVVSVTINLLVCLAVRLDKALHHMTFYFLVSLAVVHVMLSLSVMPPAIIIGLAGRFTFSEELCKLWITMDLFFCNNLFLHLAFANMDAFLRLKDPLRRGRVITACSVLLWIGASWMISLVQGIAQFMLSQGDHGVIHHGVCFISDKNFIILGTLFSFIIPVAISILFYALCANEIRALKRGKYVEESEGSTQNMYRYASNESIPDNASDSTSCESHENTAQPRPREEVQLAVVTNMADGQVKECVQNAHPNADTGETTTTTTSFCEDPNNINKADPTGLLQSTFAEQILTVDLSTSSCTLLLRDAAPEDTTEEILIRENAEHDHSSPDETIRYEQNLSRLMFVLLLTAITLWVPLTLSNVIYGLCKHCRVNVTFDESNVFNWLAYSSALLAPLVYMKFCEPLREACWKVMTCVCCVRKS